MAQYVIYSRLGPDELKARLSEIPRIMSGSLPDRRDIARGFGWRLAHAWFSKVRLAFIVKSRGGTDDCGISWPPLSQNYLAYRRGPASSRTAGGLAPKNQDGFLTPKQLRLWRGIFWGYVSWLSATMDVEEAKRMSARIAWATLKRMGARTKWNVFGTRSVEILRDTGTLFNSLQPGVLSERGASADYAAEPNQIATLRPGQLAVGTNVQYASYHQGTDSRPGRRRIWPRPDEIPQQWLEDFNELAASGLPVAIELIARAG